MSDDKEEPLIVVEGISKKFCRSANAALRYGLRDIVRGFLWFRPAHEESLRPDEFYAVRDVSFALRRGESLAILGHNGAGKSTLLKLLIGCLKPTQGRIVTRGRMGTITDLGLGFDMSLSGRENIYVGGSLFGLSREEIDGLVETIVDFAELHEVIDAPVLTYSTGMRARLGYSIAAHLEPDLLLVDEALAVGDIHFRRKCILHIKSYLDKGGALVWVSHDMHLVQAVCNKCLVLERGRELYYGDVVTGLDHYFQLGRERTPRSPARTEATKGALTGDLPEEEAARGRDPISETPESREENDLVVESASTPEPDFASKLKASVPVTLESLTIAGESGGLLRHQEPAHIVLRYRSLDTVREAGWAFMISPMNVPVVLSFMPSPIDAGLTLRRGSGELRCLIPALPLRAGKYVLKAVIGQRSTGTPLATLGWDNPPVIFSVAAEICRDTNSHAAVGDFVSLDVVWIREQPTAAHGTEETSALTAMDRMPPSGDDQEASGDEEGLVPCDRLFQR